MENNYQQEIVDNIKHEPERHFILIMPNDPEPEVEELKEVKIILRKFDRKYKSPSKFFETYFVCNKCDFATKHSQVLKPHYKFCEALQKCEVCCFMSKCEKINKCGFCDLKFECNNCKTNHHNQDHCKDSIWHCNKCDHQTLNKHRLKQHYLTHEKKFSCETCDKSFAQKDHLKNHQQQHRHGVFATKPETKFKCKSCIRSFATKFGLRRHERVFHRKCKFHCDFCGKTSKTKRLLQNHMQRHTKVPCPICQQLLAGNRFRRHIKQHSTTIKFEKDDYEKSYTCKKDEDLILKNENCHQIVKFKILINPYQYESSQDCHKTDEVSDLQQF